MTTITPTAETAKPKNTGDGWQSHVRVTTPRAIKSEWIKFWSLRSSWITLLSAVTVFIGIGVIATSASGGADSSGLVIDPTSQSMAGTMFAQLILGALGVLFAASEYSTGMIRSTLAGVPKRLPVLWAKLTVLISVVFTTSLAASFAAFFAGQAILGTDGVSITDSGVLRAVVGTAVYLAGASAIGLALGSVMRSTAAAITTLVGGLFILPTVSSLLLPESWSGKITPYLPSSAGDAFSAVTQSTDRLSPAAGLAVFAGYLAIAVAAAAWRLKSRDA